LLILGFQFSVFHSALPLGVVQMIRLLQNLFLLAILATALGCQREPPLKFAPVEGTVTKGCKPLVNVVVLFLGDPEGGAMTPLSSGATDADGHYRLHTDQGDDGAVVGRHRVCIVEGGIFRQGSHPPNGERRSRPNELTASPQVPPSYANKNQTILRAEVRPGEQVINLEVP
jgi:hypothetical protein